MKLLYCLRCSVWSRFHFGCKCAEVFFSSLLHEFSDSELDYMHQWSVCLCVCQYCCALVLCVFIKSTFNRMNKYTHKRPTEKSLSVKWLRITRKLETFHHIHSHAQAIQLQLQVQWHEQLLIIHFNSRFTIKYIRWKKFQSNIRWLLLGNLLRIPAIECFF